MNVQFLMQITAANMQSVLTVMGATVVRVMQASKEMDSTAQVMKYSVTILLIRMDTNICKSACVVPHLTSRS